MAHKMLFFSRLLGAHFRAHFSQKQLCECLFFFFKIVAQVQLSPFPLKVLTIRYLWIVETYNLGTWRRGWCNLAGSCSLEPRHTACQGLGHEEGSHLHFSLLLSVSSWFYKMRVNLERENWMKQVRKKSWGAECRPAARLPGLWSQFSHVCCVHALSPAPHPHGCGLLVVTVPTAQGISGCEGGASAGLRTVPHMW